MNKIFIFVKNLLADRKFWIGFYSAWLISIIEDFINGEADWKQTMFWGSLAILIIGYDKLRLEDEKNK